MAQLVQEIARGGPSTAAVEDYPRPVVNAPIRAQAGYFAATLGDDVPDAEAVDDLARLHFDVAADPQGVVATPPNFRLDVREPIDLVEEVGRLHGYNSLPSTLPGRRQVVERILPPPDLEWEAREIAMGAGYDEVINTSFEPPGDPPLGVFPSSRLRLTNPMASDQALMRTSLLPGLSRAVARNVDLDVAGVRIFELGRVFWPQPAQELPLEARVIGVAAHVAASAGQPSAAAVRAVLLAVKGFFELLTERLSAAELGVEQTAIDGLHPGRGLRLNVDGAVAGCVGQLHPELAARLGGATIVVGELNFDAIAARPRVPRHNPVPKYPAVVRDLAITVPELTLARDAISAIQEAGGAILRSVELYDEYRGAQVGEGRKGLTFRLLFQSDDRTLTGEEVSATEARIVAATRSDLNAELRG
jgi:phenylalanyl-tRNA synthetase beta chain